MTKQKGLLIVFSGPSGVGKGTMLARYMENRAGIRYSISATTRAPREGEVHGTHYYFLSRPEFETMIMEGQMLEHAKYNDNYYGTPRKFVDARIDDGEDVVLEIEVQGATQIRSSYPDALFVFIMPPTFAHLRNRLVGRGTEDDGAIRSRLAAAISELRQAGNYDYVIVNDDLDRAVYQLESVIEAAKCSVKFQKKMIEEVLENA